MALENVILQNRELNTEVAPKKTKVGSVFSAVRRILAGLSGAHLIPFHNEVIEQQRIELFDQNYRPKDLKRIEQQNSEGYENLDRSFAKRTIQRLDQHNLNPDGKTLYFCDTGLGHAVAIASYLKHKRISSRLVINNETTDPVHLQRFTESSNIFGSPTEVQEPLGEMIILEGHSIYMQNVFDSVKSQLPDKADLIKTGIKRIVILQEANWNGKLQDNNSDYFMRYSEALLKYVSDFGKEGFEIYAVDVDPR